MKTREGNSSLLKQRITVMMVLFFCMLVSGVEYLPTQDFDAKVKKEAQAENDDSSQNYTFLDVAVDAVVPFVTTVGHQVFYIIYEIFNFESISIFKTVAQVLSNLEFREILFERIISTNAP